MKAKDLIKKLGSYDPDTEVYVITNSHYVPNYIPDYGPIIECSDDFVDEWDLEPGTICIFGK